VIPTGENPAPIHYRAAFLSDWHLGFQNSHVKALLSFLKAHTFDTLYLVGDIFDFWAMQTRLWWDKHCNEVIRQILKMLKNGMRLILLPGNHDDGIRHFTPLHLGFEITVVDEARHVTSCGTSFIVIHGDQFDFVVGHMRWLSKIGANVYDFLISLNGVVNGIRSRLGFKRYWSLSAYLKMKAKSAVSFIQDFETAALRYAASKECDGIICGHIHTAKILAKDGLIYANCGDWVESLTALVENANGVLDIVHWPAASA